MDQAAIITQVEANKQAIAKVQEEAAKVKKEYHVSPFALALQEATAKIARIGEDSQPAAE